MRTDLCAGLAHGVSAALAALLLWYSSLSLCVAHVSSNCQPETWCRVYADLCGRGLVAGGRLIYVMGLRVACWSRLRPCSCGTACSACVWHTSAL